MNDNQTLARALAQAEQIITVWAANPGFQLDEVDLFAFQQARDRLVAAAAAVEAARAELAARTGQCELQTEVVFELAARARDRIRATYGSDSVQYEEATGVGTAASA